MTINARLESVFSLPRTTRSFVEYTGHGPARPAHEAARPAARGRRHRDHRPCRRRPRLGRGARRVRRADRRQRGAVADGALPEPGPAAARPGGVCLIDAPGADLFETVADGSRITVRGGNVYRGSVQVASGRVLTEAELAEALADQRTRVTEALAAFAENTMRYLRDEGRLLAEGIQFPQLDTRFRDRHALVVARGPGHKRDLRIVKPYVRDFQPVLVGVDGGADALIDAGYKPDVIVGDMDSVSDRGAPLGRRDRRARLRGRRRAGRAARAGAGRPVPSRSGAGVSEDVAMLLAYEKGAELIVAVGTHFNLTEFLERNRRGCRRPS